MFGLFNKTRIPKRHRTSAYMNLAFGILPTVIGTWDQVPAELRTLTDNDLDTNLATIAEDSNNAVTVGIEIDLTKEYEVYEIDVHHAVSTGFKKHSTDQAVKLYTVDEAGTETERETQTIVGNDTYQDSTLHYHGNGIPVRKVRIKSLMNSAKKLTFALAEIEVMGA